MFSQKFVLLITLAFIFSYSSLSQAKEYDCNDLRSLQSQIKNDSKNNLASVSAMIIRIMGRNPNPCVKNVIETDSAVEVKYLDGGIITSDVFNFSNKNQLVSVARTFSNETSQIINF